MSNVETGGPPRLSHRQAGIRVVLGLTLTGAALGAGWAWLAPPIQIAVALTRAGERVRAYVGNEGDLVFFGPSLMIGMLTALAVTAEVAAWQWKAHRGPVLVGALLIGALAAAGAATGVGAVLVRWRYGAVDVGAAPVTPEQRVSYALEAPAVYFGHTPLQIAVSLAFPVGLAALLYTICALSTRRDDLGAWPPIEHPHVLPFDGPTDRARTMVADRLADPPSPSR